jgi:phosphate transport system permease protein
MTGLLLSDSRQSQRRSRQRRLEAIVMGLLISAASIAILVTVGIVLSMVFETVHFFRIYDWTKFFFGSTWSPNFRGDSELAILPLLWGTLYISAVALLVAVPVGLFAAVYLAEFAGSKVRATAKPLLELLAGIPTIVYGLFALITVGPGLVRLFGEGGVFGVSWMAGASSVLTAGLVMGMMLIPFVSSLSDDIINAVPQSLRDGSLGLGATRLKRSVRSSCLPHCRGSSVQSFWPPRGRSGKP